MHTRSQTRNLHNQHQAPPAVVEPFNLEDPLENHPPPPPPPMDDQRTMAQLLEAPTEGYEDAIVVPEINANFELKHGLINLVQNKQFFGHDKEDPHAHIQKEPPRSIQTWDDLVSKFINKFFPPSKTTNLRNEITRFQQRFDETFYEAWDRFNDLLRAYQDSFKFRLEDGGNFLDKMPRDCLRIIESKSKVRNSRNKPVVAKVSASTSTPGISSEVAELKEMVKALLLDKKNQSPAPTPVKAVEQSCVVQPPAYQAPAYQPPALQNQGVSKEDFHRLRLKLMMQCQPLSPFLALEDDPTSPEVDPTYYDPEGDILLLEAILNSEPSPPLQGNYFPETRKDLKICEANHENSSVNEPPEVELKDLPPHLEYAFLEGDDKLPVIIAKDLKNEEKAALIEVLKSHKRAIAWKLSDIKGINPEFCTHKILMEEDYEPTVQHQRRVNPKIHDVIKKEVEKLLDAGLIYPISDSPWVSPVHSATKDGWHDIVKK
ncbi:reverse transcriptase domain-containing protein [Tanacetum coccineum]|uniref:Reverse transcriptase domain-containing protein n=1 Tax=Tanacetum coccineum TaxID=301880 RepID=A0ABQ5DPE0_9ASTR